MLLFPVLNGKANVRLKQQIHFSQLFPIPTNVDEIGSDDGPWEDLDTHQILTRLLGKQQKVDLPFKADVSRLEQAAVCILH